MPSLEERFWAKVRKTDGCWYWTAAIQHGYGIFSVHRRKQVKAHVWLWEQVNGPKPVTLELDHKCRNRSCVRPPHLELVTKSENARRRPRKYRCPSSHLKSPDNTYVTPQGVRQCRECKRESWRAMYYRKRDDVISE